MLNLFAHYMFEATRIGSSANTVQRHRQCDRPIRQAFSGCHCKDGRSQRLNQTSTTRQPKVKFTCPEN